jgi:hypothetical protein
MSPAAYVGQSHRLVTPDPRRCVGDCVMSHVIGTLWMSTGGQDRVGAQARLTAVGLGFHPEIGHRVSCREGDGWTVADTGLVRGLQLERRV